jgi:hypothetical protein
MAVRRLRIRRGYCLGLDGNLQLPSESLRVALAYTHGNGNRNGYCYPGAEVYADAQAASHTSAAAVSPAFNGRFFGDSRSLASPRNAQCGCNDSARSALEGGALRRQGKNGLARPSSVGTLLTIQRITDH